MKNLKRNIVLVTLLSSVVFAAPTAQQKFKMADMNKDGMLSSQEFYNDQARKMAIKVKEGRALKGAATAPTFTQVDRNKDGQVSFNEYDNFHTVRQQQMQKLKKQQQGNGSGQGAKKGMDIFNQFDTDKSGTIDKTEFRELYRSINTNNKASTKGKGSGQGMQQGKGQANGMGN